MIAAAIRNGVVACAALALWPGVAHAHLVSTRFGDFYSGMLHPMTALEHMVPWLALGLLAGLQQVRVGRWVPLAFAAAVFFGVILALVIPSAMPVPALNLASFVALGALVALGWQWPTSVLLVLAVTVGLIHGYDNGLAVTPETNALLFVPGVATSGIIVVLLITAVTSAIVQSQASWTRIAVRAVGSWIAAVGVMVVGLNVAG